MRFRIEKRGDYLVAEIRERETAQDMRDFLTAVKLACTEHACPNILMLVRDSRPVFKAEEYGLAGDAGPGYAADLATPRCRIALVGDSSEMHYAHEYIELVARQQAVNVRSFRDQKSAAGWLSEDGDAGPASDAKPKPSPA